MFETKEELAKLLNNRPGTFGLTKEERNQCIKNGLVVVSGASDDLMEFDGAINEEYGAYGNGQSILFTKLGKEYNSEHDEMIETLEKELGISINIPLNSIDNFYFDENNQNKYLQWSYKTKIPHSKFKYFEDSEYYSIGIIFSISDLK